jgi:MerR family transcriptional regulator, light-induced transcriptional regulator
MQSMRSDRLTIDFGQNQQHCQSHIFDMLSEIVESDILPTLCAAHTGDSLRSALKEFERTGDVIRLTTRIATSEIGMSTIIGELAYQACAAGIQWEEDEIDFYDVTARLGRLQTIARHLSALLERPFAQTGQSILLMPCPGEAHVFGLQLLSMSFRDAGWTVTQPEANSEWPGERLARLNYDAVGLSLSNVGLLSVLRDEIARLRRASRNKSLCVLVGGSCFDRGDVDFKSVGADAYAPDACSAPAIAAEVVNEQKLICRRSATF